MNIIENYIPQPLTVYAENFEGDRARWNRNQCQCEGQETFEAGRHILTKEDDSKLDVPVFHIKRDAGGSPITTVTLKSVDGTVDFDLTGFVNTENDLDNPATKEAIVFAAHTYTDIQSLPDDTPLVVDDKEFYLEITDGETVWYTETFFTKTKGDDSDFPEGCLNCNYIQVTWVNSGCIIQGEDGVGIVHSNTGVFSVFFEANVARAEYEFEPDGQGDGQGGTTRNFLRTDKLMQFVVTVPEYMADALAVCQVMSSVFVNFPNGDFIQCRDVTVAVDWGQPEPITNCYAQVTFKFRAASWMRSACC